MSGTSKVTVRISAMYCRDINARVAVDGEIRIGSLIGYV